MAYRRPRRPQLVGHMGYPAHHPPNTVVSAVAAVVAGADMVEIDVSMTADGRCIAIHGPDLDQTTSGTGPVAKASLAHIKSLDVTHRGQVVPDIRVPEVAEIIAAIPGARFNFDLKTGAALRAVLALIESGALADRAVISGATAWNVGRVRRARVGVTALLNLNRLDKAFAATSLGRWWLPIRYRRLLTRPDVLALNINHQWVSRSLVEAVHRLGAEVWTYTADSQDRADELVAMDVDSITTNRIGDITV